MIKLYNTLNRKKEQFKPIKEGKVGIYACGPTVYNYVHIGNLRAMIFYDLLNRYLRYKGFDVKFVMNITDVDDKTIRDSIKEGKTLKEFTEFYESEFWKDIDELNILRPDIVPKATAHIKEMVGLITTLKDKGYTYESNGSTYFKISKFKEYGKLACLNLDSLKDNADGRINNSDEYEKEDARDFALWKAWDKDDGDVFWETKIGKGRPGWHIECSAMSSKYLGQPFDIHVGGVDLVFPHHTNEIAQAEAATGKKFVNFWMHNDHLIVNGEKMSKSLGNFYTLRDLKNKGYEPKAIRYQLLSTQYRTKLNFTEEALIQIPATIKRFEEFLSKLDDIISSKSSVIHKGISKLISTAKEGFESCLDDDLNMSGALASIFDFMKEINKLIDSNELGSADAKSVKSLMLDFDKVLAIMDFEKIDIPKEVLELAEKREAARKNKDYAESDKLRDELAKKGFTIDDTPSGPKVKKL